MTGKKLALAWTLWASCSPHEKAPQLPLAPPSITSAAGVAATVPRPDESPSSNATAAPATEDPTLLITDPAVLAALEHRGLELTALLGGEGGTPDNHALAALPRFAPVVGELEHEIAEAARVDRLAGVDVARFSHRLFDRRFLRLGTARFVLAGVVNRPDRAPFAQDSCGETRLVYRLEYAVDAEHASKLPMTLGLELPVPRTAAGCREAVARWLEPHARDAEARAEWLRSEAGPLAPGRTTLDAKARLVVNLQLVRWPATVRPDLGGHAEYLLRSFRPDATGVLRTEPLENTVDPERFRDPAQKQSLLAAIEEQAARVEAGTATLPQSLLARRAISVTPRGLHRLSNRPFSAALDARSLGIRDYSAGRFVKSALGALRRLDQLSCPGCHQARSVAGFHLLGEDRSDAPTENALALAASPQVLADLPRRLRVARAMLAEAEPDFTAPFAERPSGAGKYGEACGLGDDASFSGWQCEPGLRCDSSESTAASPIGQCAPVERSVGDACERGAVTQTANRLRDRIGASALESCPSMVCNRSGVGFPGGMCTASCGDTGSRCGAIAILDPFNACLARRESFLSCVRRNVMPAGLRACDAESPCRDDYVCARTPEGGACLPPYFVFQLRVDGHSTALR